MDQSADHQILVDDKVSSYIIAGNKIFYSLTMYSTRCKIKTILHDVEIKRSEFIGYN